MREQIGLAIARYEAGKPDEAGKICRMVLSQEPRNHSALNLLGSIEYSAGNYLKARGLIRRAIEISPDPAYRINLGAVAIRIGDQLLLSGEHSAALESYEEALAAPELPGRKTRSKLEEIVANTRMLVSLLAISRNWDLLSDCPPRPEYEAAIWAQISESISSPAIVFFHIGVHGKHPFLPTTATTTSIDYLATLQHSVQAARRTNPSAELLILTDERTELGPLEEDCVVLRLPLDKSHLMYSRMLAYRAITASGAVTGPIVFLDTDVQLNRDIQEVFSAPFDIGLTYRTDASSAHMPFNEGVIMASGGAVAARFFQICLALYEKLSLAEPVRLRYPFNVKHWRGGQLSLAAFTDWKAPPRLSERANIRGLACRFFPCAEYNYAVLEDDRPEDLGQKWALHFKGNRKHLISKNFVK